MIKLSGTSSITVQEHLRSTRAPDETDSEEEEDEDEFGEGEEGKEDDNRNNMFESEDRTQNDGDDDVVMESEDKQNPPVGDRKRPIEQDELDGGSSKRMKSNRHGEGETAKYAEASNSANI